MRVRDDRQALTGARLADLLGRLHADAEQAGVEYERLRHTLIRFFDWRGGWPPDECADECLDRLARRLEEDVAIADIRQFALGIARHVLLERRRRPIMSSITDLPEAAKMARATPAAEESPRLDCFDRCLSEMPSEGRALVIGYYEGERDTKIANRRRLSASLGLSENALRSRVQRLRDRLEACVQACLGASGRRSS